MPSQQEGGAHDGGTDPKDGKRVAEVGITENSGKSREAQAQG